MSDVMLNISDKATNKKETVANLMDLYFNT